MSLELRSAPSPPRDLRSARRRYRRRRRSLFAAVVVLVVASVVAVSLGGHLGPRRGLDGQLSATELVAKAAAVSPLRGRIVSVALDQLGYRTDPPETYCNKYSAYWVSGTADCGNSNLDEEWCADFAAWVWKMAGADVTYQYLNGDLDSSSASFYEWGMAQGTWHPVDSGYLPLPGDVAVYGLDAAELVAQHVAVVVNATPGRRGPDVVNGDGDRTGFSVVELGIDEFKADIPGSTPALLSGYVAPS